MTGHFNRTGRIIFDDWSKSLTIDKSAFASAKAGDKILITAGSYEVSSWEWGAQVFIKTMRAGWDVLTNTLSTSDTKQYSVEITDDEIEIEEQADKSKVKVKTSMLAELKEYGLVIQGMASKITKVEFYSAAEYDEEGTVIEPDEYWNFTADKFAAYSADDKFVFTYTVEGELTKDGSSIVGWGIGTIKSLKGNVTVADINATKLGTLTFAVTKAELQAALDDEPTEYNLQGINWNMWPQGNATVTRVSLTAYKAKAADEPTAISSVKANAQNAVRYNLAGQKVDQSYKGVVIENGKKFVVK